MPQVTCPNCGLTINLENRRKIDFNLIKRATRRKPRTFTELLHITRLPRKTLNLRLKELCSNGALVKRQNAYELNGASSLEHLTINSARGLPGAFGDRRMKTGFMLVMLIICFSASGYVLARYFPLPPAVEVIPGPAFIGNFTMALSINDVNDLYTLQIAIDYNQDQMEVLEITAGSFLGEDFIFVNSTDSGEDGKDLLLLGGSLKGHEGEPGAGKSGSGILATVVFGYFVENYDVPEVVPWKVFETFLLDSEGSMIPIMESTLTLSLVD